MNLNKKINLEAFCHILTIYSLYFNRYNLNLPQFHLTQTSKSTFFILIYMILLKMSLHLYNTFQNKKGFIFGLFKQTFFHSTLWCIVHSFRIRVSSVPKQVLIDSLFIQCFDLRFHFRFTVLFKVTSS